MHNPLQPPTPMPTDDLQFTTSVDPSFQQNVQVPSHPPTLNPNAIQMQPDAAVPGENEETYLQQLWVKSRHPYPCIFHVLFKGLAIGVYLLGGAFENGTNFITVTVFCILLLAADFWVVKNITGRLLVGLRWWAQVEGEDGSETRWIFEAAPADQYTPNKFDSTWFWTALYVTPLIWSGFFFIGLLKWHFGWLITVCFAIASSSANVYGYWHCSNDQKAKFQQMVATGTNYGANVAIKNNVFGKMAGFATRIGGMASTPQQGQPQQSTFV